MKISIFLFTTAILVFSGVAYSQFMPKGQQGIITAIETKKMGDDQKGSLEGYIVNNIRDDHYIFRDKTGEMEVEIDDKKWRGQVVGPETKVRIHGEMDRGFFSSEFEVKRLEVIPRVKSQMKQNSSPHAPKVRLVRS